MVLAGPVEFNAVLLDNATLPAADRAEMVAFHKKVAEITRVMQGTENYAEELFKRANDILQALNSTPNATPDLKKKAEKVVAELDNILNVQLNRNTNKPSEEENPPAPVPLNTRLGKLSWISWASTQTPTQTQLDAYKILEQEFPPVYNSIKQIGEVDLKQLEQSLNTLNAPANSREVAGLE